MKLQRSYRLRTVTFCALVVTAVAGLACNAVSPPATATASATEPESRDDVAFLEVTDALDSDHPYAGSPWPDAAPFRNARQLPLHENRSIIEPVTLTSADQLVVLDLGPAAPGDRFVVKQLAAMEEYTRVAFFDGDHDLLRLGVCLASAAGSTRPVACDVFVTIERLYVAVDVPAEVLPIGLDLELTRTTHDHVDCAVPAVVVLNFDGTVIDRLGLRENMRVQPFRAADVCNRFNADTPQLRERIVEAVRRDFEPLGITIEDSLSMDMDAPGARVAHVGPTDIANLGAASGEAVVNTAAFSFLNQYDLSDEEIAQAIANVASHEIGHLFGLNHTTDAADVMNATASTLDLFVDQSLSVAPLDPTVFPIGMQDSRKWIQAHAVCTD